MAFSKFHASGVGDGDAHHGEQCLVYMADGLDTTGRVQP
jgi:hypothetical protein